MKKYFVSGLTEEDSLQDGQNKYEEYRNCQAKRSARKGADFHGAGGGGVCGKTSEPTLDSKTQYFLMRKCSRIMEGIYIQCLSK
jgi:hypothetical protein